MRIALYGTFDVENFGDLLFPLVARRRLDHVADELLAVSPAGGDGPWGDCMRSVSLDEVDGATLDGILVGGGNIIHAGPGVDRYRTSAREWLTSYARLWTDPVRLASANEFPVCWNAPGVPAPFSDRLKAMVQWATRPVSHLAVRDKSSERMLRAAGVDRAVSVAPDPAFDVRSLFTAEDLDDAVTACYARAGAQRPERTLVIHLNRRYIDETMEVIVRRLERISTKLKMTPVLIGLGPCHGDADVAQRASALLGVEHLILERPRSLREVVGLIGRGEMYIGSSLHGMITAIAFDKPALAVAREPASGGKFSGQAEQLGLEDAVVASWREAEGRIESTAGRRPGNERIGALQEKLGSHWAQLLAGLRGRPALVSVPQDQPRLDIVLEEAASSAVDAARRAREAERVVREEAWALQDRIRELEDRSEAAD